MSIISCTSPRPSWEIFPTSSVTSAPSASFSRAELLAEQADELAATRRRHLAPRLEGGDRAGDGGIGGGLVGAGNAADLLAGDRRPDDEVAVRHARGVDAEPLEKRGGGTERVEGSSSDAIVGATSLVPRCGLDRGSCDRDSGRLQGCAPPEGGDPRRRNPLLRIPR